MILDLHTHTQQRSLCSHVSEKALIKRAIDMGLNGIAITDHNALVSPEKLKELNENYHPFLIFKGIEISLMTRQRWQDFLVIGLDNPVLERTEWDYKHLVDWVRKNKGWICWAHPFRYCQDMPPEIAQIPPDAMEICSTNIHERTVPLIRQWAEKLDCKLVGVSDAHYLEDVGYHTIRLSRPVATNQELVLLLKNREFEIEGK
jgi:histidinol phosphatase-like PHP family hydrolase